MKKKYIPSSHWAIPEKIQTRDIKEIACKISRGDQEKIIWNFQGSWFLVLEFPREMQHISFAQFPGVEL